MTIVRTYAYEDFPTCLAYGFTAQPEYLVNVNPRDGGYERVSRRWTRPLNVYTAVPTGTRDEEDMQNILYFWHAMGGRARTFRFKDWTDYKSCNVDNDATGTDQLLLGVGFGGGLYRLAKRYNVGLLSQLREITQPSGDTIIITNEVGAEQDPSTWTLDETTGLLHIEDGFTGTATGWGGEFLTPCRFDSECSLQIVDKALQSVDFTLREKRLVLITVMPS